MKFTFDQKAFLQGNHRVRVSFKLVRKHSKEQNINLGD